MPGICILRVTGDKGLRSSVRFLLGTRKVWIPFTHFLLHFANFANGWRGLLGIGGYLSLAWKLQIAKVGR
ncbi:hypothetical protein PoMZ_13528 [Pyricularia oryzae]|uniref:Uncharacterized protein n=1 Tax=Pyricularia oryzae TaxID=318829 RepID=A0A4P7NXE2_PYROR|nr:hypothetical protein PoMZ_13528 [Pyricularia oryzae]